jgi:hypothetical protein
MNPEQLQQLINWLNLEIERLNESIDDALKTNNHGRKVQYEGMRDAFSKFLNEFKDTQKEKTKIGAKKISANI